MTRTVLGRWARLEPDGSTVLDALWAWYDGRRRKPYNHIECGDHYARSLAGWSMREALAGFRHDVAGGALAFLTSTGRGLRSAGGTTAGDGITMECTGGTLDVRRLTIEENGDAVGVGGRPGPSRILRFPVGLRLEAGQILRLALRSW